MKFQQPFRHLKPFQTLVDNMKKHYQSAKNKAVFEIFDLTALKYESLQYKQSPICLHEGRVTESVMQKDSWFLFLISQGNPQTESDFKPRTNKQDSIMRGPE